jgi:iron complex outermembrane receptor protein
MLVFRSLREPHWFAFFALWFCATALAEESATLAPVVVEALAPPAFQTYPELTTGQVTVIHRGQFRSDQLSVADVLETAPGVQVQSTGELGSYASLSVRGATGQQSLVYIDGIPITASGGEAVDLSQLSLNQVESIEIYRTVAPPQFAQNAMGGVVNIVTTSQADSASATSLGLKTGSFGLREFSAVQRWQGRRQVLSLRASAVQAENDFPFNYNAGTPDVPDDDVSVQRNNAGYSRYSLGANYRGSEGDHQFQASASGQVSRKQLPGWNNSETTDTYYDRTHASGTLGWSVAGLFDGVAESSLRARYTSDSGHLKDPTGSIGIQQNDSRDQTNTAQLSHVGTLFLGPHLMTLVNEHQWTVFALDDPPANTQYEYERRTHATSLTDEWVLPGDRVWLNGSVRSLWVEDTDTLWGGHLGSRAELSDAWSVTANVTQANRLPSLFEQYGNQGYFRGNPDLEPESSRMLELSIQRRTELIDASLTGYYRIAKNNIAPIYNSQGVGRYVNIGEVHYQGLEWSMDVDTPLFELSHQGSYQPSRVYSPTVAYDGNQAPGYYPWSLSTDVSRSLFGLNASVRWRYEQGLYYDRANSTRAPDRSEIDLTLSRTWNGYGGDHRAEFSLMNLFDTNSMDISRKPLPGRRFMAGYSLHF